MNNDILTIYNNDQKEEYRLLLIIDKEYKYIIYTDMNNLDINNNLYAIKVKALNDNEETLPINDDEWKMIEEEYNKLINK